MVDQLFEGINIRPETFAPTLPVLSNGAFHYQRVMEYNYLWLKHQNGDPKRIGEYEPFNPGKVWTDDRWMFVRRIAGNAICRKVFHHVRTFIWFTNDFEKGKSLTKDQDALIQDVLRYTRVRDFMQEEKGETFIMTWDG